MPTSLLLPLTLPRSDSYIEILNFYKTKFWTGERSVSVFFFAYCVAHHLIKKSGGAVDASRAKGSFKRFSAYREFLTHVTRMDVALSYVAVKSSFVAIYFF